MAGSKNILVYLMMLVCLLSACKDKAINDPHGRYNLQEKVFFSFFVEQPKTLDPAKSYGADENLFTAQIYEPPLQYHYLKRPYKLVPLTAAKLPEPKYYDASDQLISADDLRAKVAYSVYTISIKPGIFYQPHPALAKDEQGNYLYHNLTKQNLLHIDTLADFKKTGTRELIADDYIYEIKRLGSPSVQSPIAGFLSHYILGLKAYSKALSASRPKPVKGFFDLRQHKLEGVKKLDKYTLQISIKGKYPQFKFWLAMPFFAPIPWEADKFYSQRGLQKKNISFDWYPIGTGPYMIVENNPNRQIVMARNPNFHQEFYPSTGMPGDTAAGLLADANKPLPFVDRYVFSLDKESIPRWSKFLQGYYDKSGISSDSYDQAVQVDADGNLDVTPEFKAKGIRLTTSIEPSIFYLGINMLDPTIGGSSDSARKLRRAISIALDIEEYISIFLNGRGLSAQGPIPPGIFGFEAGAKGINPYVYQWQKDHIKRRSLQEAKQLLAQAGYPNGRNAKTGKPLIISYEATSTGSPDERAMYDWMRKQLAKLGIQLNVRVTNYNRFQEKLRSGNAQLFFWGWSADYPDPENFLFLLYGPNGKVKHGGENASNYSNPVYDQLFLKMKNMPDGEARQKIIDEMLAIVRKDAPWVWGFHPKTFVLSHQWNRVTKAHSLANNTLKYNKIDPNRRRQLQAQWNKPTFWPLWLLLIIIVAVLIPVIMRYRKKHHSPPEKY